MELEETVVKEYTDLLERPQPNKVSIPVILFYYLTSMV